MGTSTLSAEIELIGVDKKEYILKNEVDYVKELIVPSKQQADLCCYVLLAMAISSFPIDSIVLMGGTGIELTSVEFYASSLYVLTKESDWNFPDSQRSELLSSAIIQVPDTRAAATQPTDNFFFL